MIRVNTETCIGCGMCRKDCAAHNIVIENHKARVLSNDCIMCGHCAAVCPKNAVTVSGYDTEPVPMEGEVRLEPEEVLVQAENLDLPDTFYIEDLPFHIAGTIMDFPRYNSSILISGQTAQLFLVVADETVVSAISDRDASRVHREFRVQVDLDGTEEEKLAFVDPLLAADANDVYSVISHQDNAVNLYTMYGGFLFLGVFLGLLFLLSTVLIIYYKQISEGYEDQRRYQIMQQVGMSPREVRSSIRSQVLLVFFLPLVTAGIHVAAAFPMLCKLLELFNLFDVRLFALCAAGTLLVFCAIYALVYGLTTRTYSRIVGGQ